MGQIILNGMETGGPGNPDSLNLDKYPAGHLMVALNMRATIPVVPANTPHTGTAADLQQLMLMAIGALTVKDGTGYVPYPTVPGDELRQVHRYLNLNEVPNDVIGTAFADATPVNVHFDLRLRANVGWLARPESRLPGPSAVRKYQVDIVEGSTVPTNFARGAGNILWDIDVETMESDIDQYAPLLGFFRDNQSRLYAMSPDGLIVGAWDVNDPFATTDIDLFSCAIGNEDQQLRKPYMVADAFRDGVIQGGSADISDSVTPLYVPPRNTDPDRLPHGKLTVRLASQYVSTIKLRGMYWPNITADMAGQATLHSTELSKTPTLGTVIGAPSPMANAGSPSTRPIRFFPASAPEFTLRPGILGRPGASAVSVSVPPTYIASMKQAVAAFGKAGEATGMAAKQNAAASLGSMLPGFTSTSGGKSAGLLGIFGF